MCTMTNLLYSHSESHRKIKINWKDILNLRVFIGHELTWLMKYRIIFKLQIAGFHIPH